MLQYSSCNRYISISNLHMSEKILQNDMKLTEGQLHEYGMNYATLEHIQCLSDYSAFIFSIFVTLLQKQPSKR